MTHNSPLYQELAVAHLLLTFYKTNMKKEKSKTEVLTELNPSTRPILLYSWIILQVEPCPTSFAQNLSDFFQKKPHSMFGVLSFIWCSFHSLLLLHLSLPLSMSQMKKVLLICPLPLHLPVPQGPYNLNWANLSSLPFPLQSQPSLQYKQLVFSYLKTAPTFGPIFLSKYHSDSFSLLF